MNTIHKIQLVPQDAFSIESHPILEALKVECQGASNAIYLWARVDPSKPKRSHRIWRFGTGHDVPDAVGAHLGSVQQHEFVWHFFEAPDR